jgi:hypothetical protein
VAKVGDERSDLEEANAGCGLVTGVTTGASDREQLEATLTSSTRPPT